MSSPPPPIVRAIAIGVVRDGDRLLVAEGVDASKGNEVFYRPLGGSIEFGEAAADTVRREFEEEMSTDVTVGPLMGVLENRFVLEGGPGHEIVMVFEASLVDTSLLERATIECVEEGGIPFVARWLPLDSFRTGSAPLYPEGLLPLLRDEPRFLLGAGTSIVSPDDRLLMLQQERKGAVAWVEPGGTVEEGESVEDCAVREALEETGLRVRLVRLILVREFWKADRMVGVGFRFLAQPKPWPQEVHLPQRDGSARFLGFRWCSRDEVQGLDARWKHDITRSAWPPDIESPIYDRVESGV